MQMAFWRKKKKEPEKVEETEPGVQIFEPRVILPNTDYIIDLVAKQRMLWIDTPHPWRFNGDDEYLTQLDYDTATGNFLDLRTMMAMGEDYDFAWRHLEKKFKPDWREAVEKLIREILSFKLFNFWGYQELLQRVIHTGMEGINFAYEEIDGLTSPTEMQHIDNRRFIYYRCNPTTGAKLDEQDNDQIPYIHILYLKQPGTFMEYPMFKLENGVQVPVHENLQILINRPYEYTLGYGRAEVGKCYWDVRTRAFLKQYMQMSIDKFILPFIVISKDPKSVYPMDAGGPGTASTGTQALLQGVGKKINESHAATVIGIPQSVQVNLMDIAGNKIQEMREMDKHYIEQIGNALLGSSAMLQTKTKTYGATQSQTKVSHFYIQHDRKFKLNVINKILMRRIFDLNPKAFKEVGVRSWRELPDIKFLSDEIDVGEQIQKIEAATEAAGEDHRVVPEELEKQLDVKLEEKPVDLQNAEAAQNSFAGGQGGFGNTPAKDNYKDSGNGKSKKVSVGSAK